MPEINRCGEVTISFVPDGLVSGSKRQKMWAVLADGVPVKTYRRKFPQADNTLALSRLWQAQQWEIKNQRLDELFENK